MSENGTGWRNRIVGHGEEAPDQLLANPRNWRIHPRQQQAALEGVLDDVGWVQDIIVNKQTGHVVDGHLRIQLALRREEPTVPVVYVDLDEAEEALILASIDPLSAMAAADKEQLDALLQGVHTDSPAVQQMLSELAEKSGIIDADWSGAMGALPDSDRAPIQQMTFTVSDSQAEIIKLAIVKARNDGPFDDTGNENGNGNALARICEAYVG